LGLAPEVQVDYREIVEWATAIVNGQVRSDSGSWTTLAAVAHDILPDWYDDWALTERERFRQLRLHALEAVCEVLVREGRYAQALMAGLAAVAAEPLRESAHRLVVRAHLGEGNLYEAYRQYRSCAALLESELGLAPSAAMESLVAPLGGLLRDRRARPDASA
jgi:DNA-binding SARP family transcriptional activator